MSDLVCPCCARPVPPGEVQRDCAGHPAAPSRAAIDAALDVIDAAARAEVFGRHAFHFVGTLRRELAVGVAA